MRCSGVLAIEMGDPKERREKQGLSMVMWPLSQCQGKTDSPRTAFSRKVSIHFYS